MMIKLIPLKIESEKSKIKYPNGKHYISKQWLFLYTYSIVNIIDIQINGGKISKYGRNINKICARYYTELTNCKSQGQINLYLIFDLEKNT